MYAIETKDLTKCFNGYNAVDKLNLRVPEGSIYGFLGPNGAGKTTTLKMLTGLSTPTTGEIRLFGNKVSFGSMKNRADIGYLPDVPGFYDWMTPAEFLRFSGELFSIDKRVLDERIESLLDLVGLNGVRKKIGGFSRGMKQRLGIAQALISEPKIVFLDEPASALDPIGRKEVMDIIAKLSGKITVFFSTHILSDIERVCDRVVILHKGKVELEDTIPNIRQKYAMHIIEVELAQGDMVELEGILKQEKWVADTVSSENEGLKVHVNDMLRAQINIPVIISAKGMALKKFAALEPTLEDIFMKVVSK
ncbi:MAG: ABC transporter ATP-binding protein [Clostridia bacterium]|nr:ABC transporter ATP-binding protein [Clostridia bacterium]